MSAVPLMTAHQHMLRNARWSIMSVMDMLQSLTTDFELKSRVGFALYGQYLNSSSMAAMLAGDAYLSARLSRLATGILRIMERNTYFVEEGIEMRSDAESLLELVAVREGQAEKEANRRMAGMLLGPSRKDALKASVERLAKRRAKESVTVSKAKGVAK